MPTESDASVAHRLFPLGYAEGPAFCNRDTERTQLRNNILTGAHTFIIGRRRYGKSSLVRTVTAELSRKRSPRVHTESLDLFTTHTIDALDQRLRDAVGKLAGQFLPRRARALDKLAKIFDAFSPKLVINSDGTFQLTLLSAAPSAQTVHAVLLGLDEAALSYNRRAVLVLDEFQQIAAIDKHHTLEGAIRNVAQEAKALSFVFLGSERTALLELFGKDRPLYNAATVPLELERITADDYRPFLAEAATMRWGKPISDSAIETILEVTDRHPAYVNLLCRELYAENRSPSPSAVRDAWRGLLVRQRHLAYDRISSLAQAQRAVLQAIATEPTSQPTGKDYLARHRIAGSTMQSSLDVLKEKDFVRLTGSGEHEIVDPLIRDIFRGAAD